MKEWIRSVLGRGRKSGKTDVDQAIAGEGDAPATDNPRANSRVVLAVGTLLVLFVVYTAATVPLPPTVQRAAYLLGIVVLAVALFPMPRKLIVWDVAILAGAAVSIGYLLLNWEQLAYRVRFEPQLSEYILGCIIIVVVLDVTRRVVGWSLPIIAVVCLAYVLFGRYVPEPFTHRGFSLGRLLANQYLSQEGLFSSILGAASNLIAIFVLFGCLMTHVGLGDILMTLAARLTRGQYGGPAKLAVVSSALFGCVSGSSTSNVVSTGTTTIPLMKKFGFSPTFSGAVETVASTGSQIMPPIMGVAAFMVADITGVPYAKIMLAAVIPAILYYLGLFAAVHLEAMRLGLRGDMQKTALSRNDLVRMLLLLPLGVLVFLMIQGYSPQKSAFVASLLLIALALPRWRRLTERSRLKELLRMFVYGNVAVGLGCAASGIIVGALNMSGATLNFSYATIELAGDSRILLLIAAAVVTLILGTGLPTVAAYAVAAAFSAPMLVLAKFGLLQAHLFVFYFACLSSVTPPVAVPAFAAAGIAGAPPMRVGFLACRLAIPGFVVPFMYVWGDSYFIGYGDLPDLLLASICGIAGVFLLAVAVIGYVGRYLTPVERIGYLGAGLMFLQPSIVTDLIGLIGGGALLALNLLLIRQGQRKVVSG